MIFCVEALYLCYKGQNAQFTNPMTSFQGQRTNFTHSKIVANLFLVAHALPWHQHWMEKTLNALM